MKRPDYWFIAGVGLFWLAIFLIAEISVNGAAYAGFPLDDTWIHAQFAHNLAAGKGFVYADSIQTPGETSPLWPVILAAAYKIFGETHVVLETRALSSIAFVLIGIATALLTFRITQDRSGALLAGVATACTGELIWAGQSGMETPLFTLLLVLAVWSHLGDEKRMSVRTGMLFGLAASTRPEAYLIFALTLFDSVVRQKVYDFDDAVEARSENIYIRLARHWKAIIAFAVPVLPYMTFCYMTTGNLLANTYYSKGAGAFRLPVPFYQYHLAFYGTVFSANPVFYLPILVGIYFSLRSRSFLFRRFFFFLFIVFPFIGALVSTQAPIRRYFIPYIPLYAPFAVVGIRKLVDSAVRYGTTFRYWVLPAIWGSIFVCAVYSNVYGFWFSHYQNYLRYKTSYGAIANFAWDVHNINEQQISMARWLAGHVPPGDVIAVNDVGAVGYFSGRRVTDLCGLVSNDVMKLYQYDHVHAHQIILDYIATKIKPKYLAIYKTWFPEWKGKLPVDSAFGIVAHNNLICGDDTVTIMKMDWKRYSPSSIMENMEKNISEKRK
ncbi:MAG TPA: hypothetical protein VFA55_07570 [Candidatus Kapabacteria bacterium]|nr:hypothetical protein [Candidatus Kapabacteria bacterium]